MEAKMIQSIIRRSFKKSGPRKLCHRAAEGQSEMYSFLPFPVKTPVAIEQDMIVFYLQVTKAKGRRKMVSLFPRPENKFHMI